MNKQQIIAGILAGGLLFSATSASAAPTGNHSKTTSEAKTSIQWKVVEKYNKVVSWNNPLSYEIFQKININKELVASNILPSKKVVWKNVNTPKQVVKSETPSKVKEVKKVQKNEQAVKTPQANINKQAATTPKQETVTTPKQQTVVTPKQETAVPKETEKVQENTTQKDKTQNAQVSSVIQQVVDLTNAERAKAGLAPLIIDSALTKSAQIKSQDMKDNNYFSHTSPTYGSPFDQMKTLGISYKSAAENIAMGQKSPQEVVQAWMNSAGHRANIMNAGYTHIGIGLSDSGYYWTQQFISK